MYNKNIPTMKKFDLKDAIKLEIKSILTEGIGDDLDANQEKVNTLKAAIDAAGENLEEVYQTRSKMEQIVDLFQDMMGDEYDGMDYRKVLNRLVKFIDDDYKVAERKGEKFSDIREEEEPTAADIKKEKSIAKEKADALKTKEAIDKIKKDLKKNKSELLKISKIDRKERTKSEQSLFDSMVDKTKELKKLEKSL
mgnify:FL=1|jgi:hypothetical protein|tara:strand:- start:337 stop:921 length:585 start_codon:yes stop_codon:yes gene_type:complete